MDARRHFLYYKFEVCGNFVFVTGIQASGDGHVTIIAVVVVGTKKSTSGVTAHFEIAHSVAVFFAALITFTMPFSLTRIDVQLTDSAADGGSDTASAAVTML